MLDWTAGGGLVAKVQHQKTRRQAITKRGGQTT